MHERLRQLEMVGRGAMAEVYRGALLGEHGTSRPVAIKRLRPELRSDPAAVDLFVNEGKIAVRLDHPNVMHALELTRDDDGYALVCEWLDCFSLGELSEHGYELEGTAAAYVGRCLCNALDYLHNLTREDGTPLGLIHRDVTPANVFVTHAGEVKLADFGVAWCKGDRSAAVAGTPEFAAPEQRQGNDIDVRVDIYGLGATLRAVARELPEDLDRLLARACAEDRESRFANARDLATALDRLSAQIDGTTARTQLAEIMERACHHLENKNPAAPRLDGAVQSILGRALTAIDEVAEPERPRPPAARRRKLRVLASLSAIAAVLVVVSFWALRHDSTEGTTGTTLIEAKTDSPAMGLPAGFKVDASPQSRDTAFHLPGDLPVTLPAIPEPSTTDEKPLASPSEPSSVAPSSSSPAAGKPTTPSGNSAANSASPAEHHQKAELPPRPRPTTAANGTVSLNSVPWAEVTIDGRKLGNTPIKSVSLAPGRHRVALFNPAQKLRGEIVIEVDSKKTETFLIDLRRGTVRKRIHP